MHLHQPMCYFTFHSPGKPTFASRNPYICNVHAADAIDSWVDILSDHCVRTQGLHFLNRVRPPMEGAAVPPGYPANQIKVTHAQHVSNPCHHVGRLHHPVG